MWCWNNKVSFLEIRGSYNATPLWLSKQPPPDRDTNEHFVDIIFEASLPFIRYEWRKCLFIDGSMERDHVLTTSLDLWTLIHLIVDLSSPTSFRKSHHFQLITIVLGACSLHLLVDWDPCHLRSKDESTLISLYSSSHRSEDGNHSTTKKQTFETSNFATKRSSDFAR